MNEFTFKQVPRQELLWAFAVSLFLCLLANIPYLIGYLFEGNDEFSGATIAPGDILSYFSKMNQGEKGHWTFMLSYSSQPHERRLVFLHYIFLGHVARWTGMSVYLVFHACRVIFGLLFLQMVYLFISQFAEQRWQRRIIFALVAFSSGLGWIMAFAGKLLSMDLTVPESNTFLSLLGPPHFTFSQTLLLIIWLCFLLNRETWKTAFVATLCMGLLAIIQPFMVAIVMLVGVVYGLSCWHRTRQFPHSLALKFIPGSLVAVPLILLLAMELNDPVLREWTAQSPLPSPHVIYFLTGYGLLLIPAFVGAMYIWRNPNEIYLLILYWAVITIVALYFPSIVQRRFSLGLHMAISFLAGIGLCFVWIPRYPASKWYVPATYLTSVLVILIFSVGAATHNPVIFMTHAESRTISWLKKNAPENAVVLSSTSLGSFIPAFSYQRAVSGHGVETIRAEQTETEVKLFFAADTTAEKRKELLRQWGVDYVIVGERERDLGVEVLSEQEGITVAEVFDEVTLYRVIQP